MLERKKGSLKKSKLDAEELEKTSQTNPLNSMRSHVRDLGGSHQIL
uniref:Uncharacterized protein n=1 Tax=Lepeophtheirus salmonis TaxID=72036 RepID=A0A0K2VLH8_LEPSM